MNTTTPASQATPTGSILYVGALEVHVEVDAQGWAVIPCGRCGGTGHYSFNGETSACYDCTYNGHSPWTRQPATDAAASVIARGRVLVKREQGRIRRAKKAEAERLVRVAAADAARDAKAETLAAHPLAVDATYYDNLLEAGAPEWQIRGYAGLARGYETAAFRIFPEAIARAAATTTAILAAEQAKATTAPLAAGRQTLQGEITGAKLVETSFGYHESSALKITVKLASGHRVYGTCPSALWDRPADEMRGLQVRFDAAVTPSDDDPTFGFFSRPTKASMV